MEFLYNNARRQVELGVRSEELKERFAQFEYRRFVNRPYERRKMRSFLVRVIRE